jgi:lipoprotein-anchoring transpeptidase ErfK/SrfK
MRRALLAALAVAATAALPVQEARGQSVATVSLALSSESATFGERVTATGRVEPAAAGEILVLERLDGETAAELGRALTDATGSFTADFEASRSGPLQARLLSSGAVSVPVGLEVVPAVELRALRGRAFVGARLVARVRPASYAARVTIVVRQGVRVLASGSGRAAGGRMRAEVPAPGLGRFTVVLGLPAVDGLAARTVSAQLRTTARTLTVGATGADVRALARRLAQLRFRVPGIGQTYSWELYDSVIAFQKAYRLPRTGVVGPQTWRRLGRAAPIPPRYRLPAAHIEVDKTRQILLDVRNGQVVAVLPTSTGATGNTPEGKHRIRWKAPATTTWLGSGILYRTMTFVGDSFAIHGWSSVPAYPASHGCVRIPIWTADWLYNRSAVGETVYVYR